MAKARWRQNLWAIMVLAALALPTTALAADNAAAGHRGSVDIAYELRFWFMPFGHTNYHVVFENGRYQASSNFQTSGLVSVFWQAQIQAGASGRLARHMVEPYIYDSFARRSAEKRQRVTLTFSAHAPPRLQADPAYNTTRYPVSTEEQEAGIDPMSAITLILSGLSADAQQPCGRVVPVFDGRRRYDLTFTYLHDQKLTLDNKLFSGTAHLCALHYRQIAGYKPNVLRGKDHWPPIFALVADISDPAAPLGHYVVPLRLWADTTWGRVTANITELKTLHSATTVH